jgi:hypothetical protein
MSTGIAQITATIAAAQDACTVQTDGYDCVAFQVGAGLTGSIQPEMSVDGSTWTAPASYGTTAGYITGGAFTNPAAQVIIVPVVGGIKAVRLRCSAYTSGSSIIIGSVESSGNSNLAFVSVVNQIQVSGAIIASASVTSTWARHRGKSSGATTAGVSVKGSAGNLHHLVVSNDQAATKAYLKLYDKATAATVGTDTPVMTILVPGNTTIVIPYDLIRHSFTLGISYGITGLAVDTDSTAVATDLVFLTMLYI